MRTERFGKKRGAAAATVASLGAAAMAACVTPVVARTAGATAKRPPVPANLNVTETVRVRSMPPSRFVAELYGDPSQPGLNTPLPAGLKTISPDEAAGTVTVSGTPDAVRRIVAVARLIDARPRCRLVVRVLRVGTTEPGAAAETVAVGVADTRSAERATLSMYGAGRLFTAEITPRAVADGAVALQTRLTAQTSIRRADGGFDVRRTSVDGAGIGKAGTPALGSGMGGAAGSGIFRLEVTPRILND